MERISLVLLAACTPIASAFPVTPNAVLLGPVERIGGAATPPPANARPIWHTAQTVLPVPTATYARVTSGALQTDLSLHRVLGGNAHAIVRGHWECRGWVMSAALGLADIHQCGWHGVAY